MRRTLRLAVSSLLVACAFAIVGPAGAAVSDSCVFDAAAGSVSITFPDEPDTSRTVSREAGGPHILYQGVRCGAATVKNTKTIDITGGAGAQFLSLDESNGRFMPSRPALATTVALGAGTDSLSMIGTPKNDWMVFSADGIRLGSPFDERINVAVEGVEWLGAYARAGDDEIRMSDLSVFTRGQGGDDKLIGGEMADALGGGSGRDLLYGSGGADVVEGGGGNDELIGDEGSDELYPGPGNDRVSGGEDEDLIASEAVSDGADEYGGGLGTDTVSYEARTADLSLSLDRRANDGAKGEHDLVRPTIENVIAGAGNDRIDATAAGNVLSGSDGDDTISGWQGADEILGGEGNDTLWGDEGDDLVRGGNGDDDVAGGWGDDVLVAEAQVDGADRYWGDQGIDTLTYAARSTHVKLAIGAAGGGTQGEHDRISTSVEVLIGGAGNDWLIGTEQAETLFGGGGRDRLDADAGADRLYGDAGNDAIAPGDGFDQIWAGDGDDVAHLVDGGADVVDCGAGIDDASDHDTVDTALVDCEVT